MATIGLVDDHALLRRGLAKLLNDFDHSVLFEAGNGRDMIKTLGTGLVPEIILLDINMPIMDGYDSAAWLREHFPHIKVMALSMYDDENSIIRMIKNGARGYILKDSDPSELKSALFALETRGYYHTDLLTSRLIQNLSPTSEINNNWQQVFKISDREVEFLKLVCTELTYKEIADKMYLSARTIDGYRDNLFDKLNIKSRVGLVLFAIKYKVINL